MSTQPLPIAQWPDYLLRYRHLVRDVYVGCCPGYYELDNALAHAHVDPRDPHCGTLCFYSAATFHRACILHELAHLTSFANGHGGEWQKEVRRLLGRWAGFWATLRYRGAPTWFWHRKIIYRLLGYHVKHSGLYDLIRHRNHSDTFDLR